MMGIFCFSPVSVYGKKVSNEDCLDCHNDKDSKREKEKTSVYVHPNALKNTAHEKVRCQDCHSDITGDDHKAKLKKVDCIRCHEEGRQFIKSDHGMAIKKFRRNGHSNRTCSACHETNGHKILSKKDEKSRVYRTHIHKVCGDCHEDEKNMKKYGLFKKHPVESYLKTVHGKKLMENGKNGKKKSATCISCHGTHNNQYRSKGDSHLSTENVSKTCGKCHEKEAKEYQGSVHGKDAAKGVREAPLCITCHGEHRIYAVKDKDSDVYKTNIST